ncbi:MAG: hypothetical protein NWE89_13900 [Candidatus Bathyarchaeota archaeon]|nr:hypothetical protein [Candidatus Bathyarchaeota archaeon]
MRKRRDKARSKATSATSYRTLPPDPVTFCREWLHYEPYKYVHPFLRDPSHFVALLMARQTGKTFNGMAKLLYLAFRHPGSTILVTAPKLGQVKRIAFKALREHLHRMKANDPALFNAVCRERDLMKTMIRLRNGSLILAEPPIPETIRGHTAKAVYLMEMNFIRDDMDLYTAVLFTINTTDGVIIAESTPWNTDSVFYRIFHKPEYGKFSTHTVPYTKAMPPHGPLTPSIVNMIKNQLMSDPNRWRREMLCTWTEETDRWLPASLIALCQDPTTRYYSLDTPHRGRFYAGIDLGKKQDHSVIAVLERKNSHLHLRHCHRFKLNTPYGVIIGYLKRLQNNWNRLTHTAIDQTGVGDYITEDMKRAGVRNLEGVIFTQSTKESMATQLRETMRTATCPQCNWQGHVETLTGTWNPHCPTGCKSPEGNPQTLTPHLHIPYDPHLLAELNTPTYQLTKTGRIHYSHPPGTHDDRFWALCLARKAAANPRNKPVISA